MSKDCIFWNNNKQHLKRLKAITRTYVCQLFLVWLHESKPPWKPLHVMHLIVQSEIACLVPGHWPATKGSLNSWSREVLLYCKMVAACRHMLYVKLFCFLVSKFSNQFFLGLLWSELKEYQTGLKIFQPKANLNFTCHKFQYMCKRKITNIDVFFTGKR